MNILKEYRDRSYINSLCCEASYLFYNTINNILLFPTILGSSILTCLNSSNIDNEKMKYTNIIINGSITIILALITQYKIHDRISIFKAFNSKYIKLTHTIDNLLNTYKDKEIPNEEIVNIINKYDTMVDELHFSFPDHIKKKIIKKYQGTNISLPNSLAIESSVVIIQP